MTSERVTCDCGTFIHLDDFAMIVCSCGKQYPPKAAGDITGDFIRNQEFSLPLNTEDSLSLLEEAQLIAIGLPPLGSLAEWFRSRLVPALAELDDAKQAIRGYQMMLDDIRKATGTAGETRDDPPTDLRALSAVVADLRQEAGRLRRANEEWGLTMSTLIEGLAEREIKVPLGHRYTAVALAEIDRLRAALDEGREPGG